MLFEQSKHSSRISSVATLSMLISLPVNIPLGAVSLPEVSISCMAMALTKKYQKKLTKAIKSINIVTLALAEMSVFKVLKDGKVDEQEFNML